MGNENHHPDRAHTMPFDASRRMTEHSVPEQIQKWPELMSQEKRRSQRMRSKGSLVVSKLDQRPLTSCIKQLRR